MGKNKAIYNTLDDKFISESHENIQTELITITKDKLENILLKYLEKLNSQKAWIAPFSVFSSLFIALLTADFKDFLKISKELWQALFIISCIASFVYSLILAIKALINRKDSSLQALMNKISATENRIFIDIPINSIEDIFIPKFGDK